MRTFVLRYTLAAVATALLVASAPVLLFMAWLITLSTEERVRFATSTSGAPGALFYFGSSVVLLLVGLFAGLWIAVREADRIGHWMSALASRADRFGRFPGADHALGSGIAEIDSIDEALRRRANEMARSVAESREFAADASHQLRTPLTALLMRLDEIATTDDLHVVREEASIGIVQVERLTQVVEDLLSRNRSRGLKRSAVALDELFAGLVLEWTPTFSAANRQLRILGESGLVVRASDSALAQVMGTLLENSLTHGAGSVDISARRAGPSVVVSVGDQAEGVDPALAPHIFERAVSTKGTGRGLALARDLVESMGGRLELVSARPAIFAVFLAASSAND